MAKNEPQRSSRDAAGVGPYARERARLLPLSDLRGWHVVDGEADIRSWEVRTLAGRVLGHVRELYVDAKAGEVVMIDVDMAGSDKRAYVPLRVVEIDRAKRVVRADSGDLEEYQEAAGARLSKEELSRVRQRDVRYAGTPGEKVVERRPVIEEKVIRRRPQDDSETRL